MIISNVGNFRYKIYTLYISDLSKVTFPFYAYLPGHTKANSISSSIMLCVPKSPLSKCFMPLWWENGPLLAAVKLRLYCDFYNHFCLCKNCNRQNGLEKKFGKFGKKKKSPTDSNKTSSHHSSDVGSLTGEICCLPFILKLLTPPMDDSSTARPFPAHSIFSHLCKSLLPILWQQVSKGVKGLVPNYTWSLKVSPVSPLFPHTHHISSSPLTPTPSQPFPH